jgi:hypothetical protein
MSSFAQTPAPKPSLGACSAGVQKKLVVKTLSWYTGGLNIFQGIRERFFLNIFMRPSIA